MSEIHLCNVWSIVKSTGEKWAFESCPHVRLDTPLILHMNTLSFISTWSRRTGHREISCSAPLVMLSRPWSTLWNRVDDVHSLECKELKF